MECIWKYAFATELRVSSEEHPVLLTEPPLNPKINKEKMCSVMFESLNIPSIYIGIQAVLSLYSSALTTGLVVDIGDGVTHVVPAFEGYALTHAIQRINIAGRDITKYLSTILTLNGIKLQTSSELEICRDIKEKICYVALDYNKEAVKSDHDIETNYELPDGNIVNISKPRFQAPEILFKPELIGNDDLGVSSAAFFCITNCDIDVRKQLYGNIMLSGGSTLFSGLPERLLSEIREKSNTSSKIKIFAPNERKFSVWIGGSILASLDSFIPLMFTREEYQESGPSGIHKKCF